MRYSAHLMGKFLIAQCGRFIQIANFAMFEGNTSVLFQKEFGSPNDKSPMNFQYLNMNFVHHMEIMKFLPIEFSQTKTQYKDDKLNM